MANRSYAGVIEEFLGRRHELMSARRGLKFYQDVDNDEGAGLPRYGINCLTTGLRLNLTVPIDEDISADFTLFDQGLTTGFQRYPVFLVNFDIKGRIISRSACPDFNDKTYLGRVLLGLSDESFADVRYRVKNARDAMDSMFRIMENKRRRVAENGLGLKSDDPIRRR